MGRGRDAVAIIDSFMVRNPNRIAADSLTLRKGNIIFEQGEYAEAIAIYRGLTVQYPESGLYPEALYRMGQSYEYLGQRDSAMILYNDVATRFPKSGAGPKALIDMADLKLRSANWNGAIGDLERFIGGYPESERLAEARFGLGRARLMLGDTAAAMTQWQMVLDSSRADDEVFTDKSRIALARIYWHRAEGDSAIALLAPVVSRRLDDLAAEALLLQGEILLKSNDLSGALAELKRLTTSFTDFPEYTEPGMLLLGQVYEQLTNLTAARDTYSKLIAQTTDAQLKKDAEARLAKLRRP
jgi:TolA-binding protein